MKYTVVKSIIRLIGYGWYGHEQSLEITLDSYQLHGIEEKIEQKGDVKEGIEEWLRYNTGDFQGMPTDFFADLELKSENVVIDWTDPESEYKFGDCYSDEY
jgi:hypothetical protein